MAGAEEAGKLVLPLQRRGSGATLTELATVTPLPLHLKDSERAMGGLLVPLPPW